MKLLYRTIIPAILILNCADVITAQNTQNPSAKSATEIAREQSQAVVVIESLDERGNTIGQGSGFIVTPNGAIVSNLHVVHGAATVRVKMPNGDVYKTSDVVDVDDNKDIVILKIKGFQLPVIRMGDSDRAEVGEPIVAISSPEGLTNSISTGVISGVRRLDTHRVFQITAPISQGSSGGALFNSAGEVIGIITYLFKSGQNINFAVPINYARGMIGDQVATTLSKLQPPPSQKESSKSAEVSIDSNNADEQIDGNLSIAARGRSGRTQQEPMFVRPDQALSFFYRLVEGLGLYTTKDVGELTRTAAVYKSKETDSFDEYSIKYLSFYSGLAMTFSKPDSLLTAVELSVSWSLTDLENTFGNKYKRRTEGKEKVLDYGRLQNGHYLTAFVDANGNVRAVRFSKGR